MKHETKTLLLSCILLDFKNILIYFLKYYYLRVIYNIKMFSFRCFISFFEKFKNNFKKAISILLSTSILYSQLSFTILISQITINTLLPSSAQAKDYSGFSRDPNRTSGRRIRQGEGSSSQYSPQNPYQNIKDNPIDNIIIDETISGDTALDRTQNGTPMVNINNATQGGVSANYYKKLDVNQENLILNNYKGEAVNTHLGGVIYGNPNMNGSNGRMADIILNEITSNQQTNITGYIEVAGKKADVIIANPNGIMVSGGGFINTARLSMITGSSINPNTNSSLDANGNLNPFKLSTEPNAVINVVGKNITNERGDNIGFNIGIDAQNTDYLTLISRVVNVAGDIIGNTNTVVEVKTGNDKAIFNKQTGEFDVSSDDTITKGRPQFAFDSTAMGGIYAGKVSIIATEHGVGVRTRGDVVAYVDDIEFDVNGNIKIEDGNLQTLNQKAQIKINNQNKSTAEKFDVEIDNSNIYGGNINIKTDNLINKNSSVIYGIEEVHIEATNDITNSKNSTIYANNLVRLKSNTLSNVSGEITAWNDIDIELLSNFITEGLIASTWGTTTISAQNITIDNGTKQDVDGKDIKAELTGYNIVLKSRNDITNTATSNLVAGNDIIFDAALAVLNHGTISAGNNLTITAGNRIMNYGALQALGSDYLTTEKSDEPYLNALGEQITDQNGNPVYIQRGGVLKLTTKAELNKEDYKLNNLSVKDETGFNNEVEIPELSEESKTQIKDIDNIIDLDRLNELLTETIKANSLKEYTIVQKHIRTLLLKDYLKTLSEYFVFAKDDFDTEKEITVDDDWEFVLVKTTYKKGNSILNEDKSPVLDEDGNQLFYKLDEYDNPILDSNDNPIPYAEYEVSLDDNGQPLKRILDPYTIKITEDDIDNDLAELHEKLGKPYNSDDWKIDISSFKNDLNNAENAEHLNEELIQYNEEQEKKSPSLTPLTLEEYKTYLINEETKRQTTERLDRIKALYDNINNILKPYINEDWSRLSDNDFKTKLSTLHSQQGINDASFNIKDWEIPELDTPSQPLDDYTTSLQKIRLDTDLDSVEQTGIHNYGTLFANTDMSIKSNSVLHNNKDSLILANNNILFEVRDIIFNNAGGIQDFGKQASIGYGIIAKRNIDIRGTEGDLSSLKRLINYDGRIEADGDINIRTNETINYGSDSCDYFKNPNCASVGVYHYYREPTGTQQGWVLRAETLHTSTLKSNQSQIVSNYGNIYIDSNNRITNYNSVIYGRNKVELTTDQLFNTIAEWTATNTRYWGMKERVKRKNGSNTSRYHYTTDYFRTNLKSNNAEARIVSGGSVILTSDNINNGANYKTITKEENVIDMPSLPYASKATDDKSLLDKVIDTGKLDLLDAIKLPTNNHGIFKKTEDPKSKYLYETDPLLIDISRFLGSQYFLNRIGLDPFSIDQKFLGDAYMEYNMIKTYLEQIGFFQNNKISGAEIDEYINNLYNTLNPEKVAELGLEIGKELTKDQINNLTEDIVWYVKKTITLPDGTETEVLVPQVYLAQESVNKLLANSNNHAELQAELSVRQATDKAVQTSTNSGNQAINTELEKISKEAEQKAKKSITQEDKATATKNTQTLITEKQEDYDALVREYLYSYKKEASSTMGSRLGIAKSEETYIYVDPNSESSCKTGFACMTSFTRMTEAQALELAKQQAYNEIYNNELNKIETAYYNEIYKEKSDNFYKNDAENVFQTAYDKIYQPTYDTAFTSAQKQNSADMNTGAMIAGDNIFIQGKSSDKPSTLNNSGTIWGNRQVVITTDQINNATASLNRDGNIAPQATIMAGDLVYLNTIQYKTDSKGNYQLDDNGQKIALSTGQINNISGMIGSFNPNSTTYIATGTLNNITNSQREELSMATKYSSYEEVRTYIGTTAQIASAGNLIIDATNDINIVGAGLLAMNSMQITAGGDFNSTTVENYNRTYSQITSKGLMTTTTIANETASLKNLSSNIYAGDNMTIMAGNDITSIGTNFGAGSPTYNSTGNITGYGASYDEDGNAITGNINLVAENNLTLKNAMDWDYSYSFYQKQSMDLATIAVSTMAGFATGGPLGAAAGAYSGTQARVGKTTMTEDYKETTSKTTLNAGGSINLQSGKDMTLISADLTAGQDIYSYSGGQTFIGTAIENSYHNSYTETNKRNLLGAAVGGAIAGKAAMIGGAIGGGIGAVYAVDKMSAMTAGISTNTKISESGYNNYINNASNFNAGGTITTIAKDSLTIVGSNLNAENGITLASLNSNVNILDVKDVYNDYSREYSKGFDKVFVKLEQQASAGIQYNETEEKSQSTSSISMGSNITSNNGNINIIANALDERINQEYDEDGNPISGTGQSKNTGNILQVGSTVYAGNGNINYTANDGNIFLMAGQNTNSSSYQYDQTTITAGVKIGNAYVDAAYAADAVVKAGEEVKKANDELKRMEDLYKEGKASKDAVEDAKLNVAMATVNLANATVAAAASVAGAATAAGTSFGTGLYGSVFMNYDTMSTTSTEQSLWNTASNVIADNGNITFNAGNDMLQEGSNVYAMNSSGVDGNGVGNITYDIRNDLIVRASADTFSSETKSENKNAGVSAGNNAVQVNVGMGQSSNRTRSTTYQNSSILAENIIIKTGNDATFSGANVQAVAQNRTETYIDPDTGEERTREVKVGGQLYMDIGNNLTVESLQDTYYSKGNSNSWSVSAGSSGGGGGFSTGKDKTDSAWVNQQTTLTGDSVSINVGTREGSEGKTTITGAIIAAGQYNEDGTFTDNGNLALNTKELAYTDINDFYTSESKGFGVQTNVGMGTDKATGNSHPSGSTTISVKSTGEEKEQSTKATLGAGTITTGVQSYTKEYQIDENGNQVLDDNGKPIETGKLLAIGGTTLANDSQLLAGLNRDVNNSQEITKDKITGALDGSITIDNRILGLLAGNTSGVKSIAKDFTDLGKNLTQIGKGLRNNIIVKSIENAVTDKNTNIIGAVQDYIRDDGKVADIQKNKELTENMNGLTNQDAEGVRDSLQDVADIAGKDGGFEGNVDLYEKYGSGNGYYYADGSPENNTIGVNVRVTDVAKSGEVINVMFHETTDQEKHAQNEQTAKNRGDTAEGIWSLKNFGNANTNQISGADWLAQDKIKNSTVIQQGNNNYLVNATNYIYNNQDGSKSFGQSNQSNFTFIISDNGKKFIIRDEGLVKEGENKHVAYSDIVDKATIGHGHLITKEELESEIYKDGITNEQTTKIFEQDIKNVEMLMSLVATRQYIQQQTDAVGSAIFNLGPQFFYKKDPVTQKITTTPTNTIKIINNANSSPTSIENAFGSFSRAGNIQGAVGGRRTDEARLYNYGIYNKTKQDSSTPESPANSYNFKLRNNQIYYNNSGNKK